MSEAETEEFDIRYTESGDAKYLKEWLSDEGTREGFAMKTEREINDAVERWISFYNLKCSITLIMDDKPVGIGTLYLQPYERLKHQCEFGIVIDKDYRNRGIGSRLLKNIMHLGKNYFNIELLHLQVRADNLSGIRFYDRFGFKEFGRQDHWMKNEGEFVGRIFMERFLEDIAPLKKAGDDE